MRSPLSYVTLIKNLEKPWLVSYDAVPEILALYEDFEQKTYGLNYSAAERHSGAEVMIFSPHTKSPAIESPAKISTKMVDKARKEFMIFS